MANQEVRDPDLPLLGIFVNFVRDIPLLRRIAKTFLPSSLVSSVKKASYRHQLNHIYRSLDKLSSSQRRYEFITKSHSIEKLVENVLISGTLSGPSSYAYVNRAIADAMDNIGVQTTRLEMADNIEQTFSSRSPIELSFASLSSNSSLSVVKNEHAIALRSDLEIRYQSILNLENMTGKVKALHSYGWDESGFPMDWVDSINENLDFVSVAAQFVAKSLRDSGVTCPIFVTGFGCDVLESEKKDLDLKEVKEKLKKFVFLHFSSGVPRKGLDLLLEAYEHAFNANDDVTLLLKTFPNNLNNVSKMLDDARRINPSFPHVFLINEDWQHEEVMFLFSLADWFVFPSRGEGAGLSVAEAMVREVPVITTGFGGQTDFCTSLTSLMCDFSFEYATSHFSSGTSVWAEPSVGHLAEVLRKAYCMPFYERKSLILSAKSNIQKFTWRKSAENILSIAGQSIGLSRGVDYPSRPIAWISTWNTRCGIATYSENLSMAFPKDQFFLLANKDAQTICPDEPFVRRVWEKTSNGLKSLLQEITLIMPQALIVQHQAGQFGFDWLFEILLLCQKIDADSYFFLHNPKEVFDYCKEDAQLVRKILSLATRIFVHRISDLNLLKEIGRTGNVTLFPHGVYQVSQQSRDSISKIPLPHSKKIVACFGFLLPHKGVIPLVEAFHLLCNKIPDLHLLLLNSVCEDPKSSLEKSRLERTIDKLGMEDRVTRIHDFLGENEILSCLKNADVIVYPYQASNESASGAIKMGIAAGRPIVVTPHAIFEDVPGDMAYRLPGFSSDEIAEGLYDFLLNEDLQKSFMANMEGYREERRWDILSERLFRIVRGGMNQRAFIQSHGTSKNTEGSI